MTLGLQLGGEGGRFLPIVTWDARAGRLFRVDRGIAPVRLNTWLPDDLDEWRGAQRDRLARQRALRELARQQLDQASAKAPAGRKR